VVVGYVFARLVGRRCVAVVFGYRGDERRKTRPVFDKEALGRLEAKGIVRTLDEAGLDVLIGLGLIGADMRGLRGLYFVPTVDNNPYMEDSDGRLHNRSIHTSGPAPVYILRVSAATPAGRGISLKDQKKIL
jgi:hypothetical protein